MSARSRLGKRQRHQTHASVETLCFAIDPDSGEVKPQAPLEFDPAFGAAPSKQTRARVGGTLEALVAAWSPAAVLHLTNCRVAEGDKIVWKDVWLQGSFVIDPMSRFWAAKARGAMLSRVQIDCNGLLIAPGFIDLQINGAFGVDFSSAGLTAEAMHHARRGLLSHGVTAICPTMVCSSTATYRHNVPLLAPVNSRHPRDGCSILGAHLEGPFFEPKRRGAHQPAYIRNPAVLAAPAVDTSADSCLETSGIELEASTGVSTQAGMAEALGSGASITVDESAHAMIRDEAVVDTAEKMSKCGSESARLGERAVGLAYGQFGTDNENEADDDDAPMTSRRGGDGTITGDLAAASDAAEACVGSPMPEIPTEASASSSASMPGTMTDSDWSTQFCNQVKVVTLAPELPGAGAVIEWLSSRGVIVSMGHTSATVDDGERAIARGATLITHLFNAMSGFHHRDPGLIGLLGRQCSGQSTLPVAKHVELATRHQALQATQSDAVVASSSSGSTSSLVSSSSVFTPLLSPLSLDPRSSSIETEEASDLIGRPAALRLHPLSVTPRPWYSVIVDGIHAHPYAVTMAFTAHPAGLVLVTDGIAALGLPCGSHSLGDMAVTVSNADTPIQSAAASSSSSTSSSLTSHGTVGSLTRGNLTLEPLTPLTRSGQDQETRLRADLAGTNTLAGAVLPLDACVRNLTKFTRCTRATAIAAASSRPAAVVGEASRRGALSAGMRADLVFLDASNLSPVQTWIAGRPAWTRHDGLTT